MGPQSSASHKKTFIQVKAALPALSSLAVDGHSNPSCTTADAILRIGQGSGPSLRGPQAVRNSCWAPRSLLLS